MKQVFASKSINVRLYLLFYLFFLSLLCIIDDFSRYNFVVQFCLSLLLFITMKNKTKLFYNKGFLLIVFYLLFIMPIYDTRIVYTLLDISLVFCVLAGIQVASQMKIKKSVAINIINAFFIVIILNVLFLFSTNFYNQEMMRYEGLFGGANLTTSIIYLMSALICELSSRYYAIGKQRVIFVLLILTSCLILFKTQTRSALFFMPYLMYYSLRLFKKKFVLSFSIIFICFYLLDNIEKIKEILRLEEDASFTTRSSFYLMFISGIIDNYFILPHGSHSAIDFVRFETSDNSMSPHNDFLRYIYEWGFIFYYFMILIFLNIKKSFVIDKNLILLTLGVASCALHNTMFSPYIFILYILFLSLYSKNNYVSSCKKI